MSIFSKIFGKKQTSETDEIVRVGGMEDFIDTYTCILSVGNGCAARYQQHQFSA